MLLLWKSDNKYTQNSRKNLKTQEKTINSRKKLKNSRKTQGFGNICRIEIRNSTFLDKDVIFNAYF